MSKLSYFWLILYVGVLTGYAIWSYSMTDPNLVLTSWAPYWSFQQWIWQTLFHNRQLLGGFYVFLSVLSIVSWFGLVRSLPSTFSFRQLCVVMLSLALPLLFSYNALSHDVFNYMFNAKMVLSYQQDPHIHVAIEFPEDPWVRFMHNTHTPAPYGYGWTAMSLLPYVLGMGKFSLTWMMFRLINVVALPLLAWLILQLGGYLRLKVSVVDLALVFLHPLVLIEMISNSHNDLWMMILAVAAFVVVYKYAQYRSSAISAAATLFLLSVVTKMATIVLLPLGMINLWGSFGAGLGRAMPSWLHAFLDALWAFVRDNFGFFASILLFVPLLTPRSQLFHPWYLIWAFVWFPMIRTRWWRAWLLSISISSLFRYVPWLLEGGYTDEILRQQLAITWIGAMLSFCLWMIWCFRPRRNES